MILVKVSRDVLRMSTRALVCKEKRAPLEPLAEKAPLLVRSLILKYEREMRTKEDMMERYFNDWSAMLVCVLIASANAL